MRTVLIAFFFLFTVIQVQAKPVRILLVTGGHDFDSVAFFNLFDSFEELEYKIVKQPLANKLIAKGQVAEFDVLVFYDMWNVISESEKEGYIKLTKQGKPFLFIHHSLVSYQKWKLFEKIIGGKYIEKGFSQTPNELSTFKHGVTVAVEVVDPEHHVTKGMSDFSLYDEVYGNYRVEPSVVPLLKTSHPESSPIIGWENSFNSSRIIYLQSGHDTHSFNDKNFRNLIINSIKYLVKS